MVIRFPCDVTMSQPTSTSLAKTKPPGPMRSWFPGPYSPSRMYPLTFQTELSPLTSTVLLPALGKPPTLLSAQYTAAPFVMVNRLPPPFQPMASGPLLLQTEPLPLTNTELLMLLE